MVEPGGSGVKSALRVLDILEWLAARAEPVSLHGVALHFGFPKSSTLALLATLVERGYVERDATDRYRLREALRARWAADPHGRLLVAAHAPMAELRASIHETVILGVLTPDCTVEVLTKLVSHDEVRYDADSSKPRPAYCTAMGRILLAHAPRPLVESYLQQAPFARLTPSTLTSASALRRRIAKVRRERVEVVLEEFSPGGSGAAVPVFDEHQRVVAALNVATVTSRFEARRESILEALRRTASLISERLGQPTPADLPTAPRRSPS